MDGSMAVIIILGVITLIAGGIMCLLGFLIFGKYLTQQKRCTSRAIGEVVGYTLTIYSSVLRYPIVKFTAEDGNEYKVKGPEYRMHSRVTVAGPFVKHNGFNVKENDEKQTIMITSGNLSGEVEYRYGENPLAKRYPIGTQLEVFYDPAAPKKGYVKRYCDKRFMFWLFQGTAAFIVIVNVVVMIIAYGM